MFGGTGQRRPGREQTVAARIQYADSFSRALEAYGRLQRYPYFPTAELTSVSAYVLYA